MLRRARNAIFFPSISMIEIPIPSVEALPEAALRFVEALGTSALRGRRVFAFRGEMGAGKTTFVKAVCQALGVRDAVNSPTFAIVNEYEAPLLPERAALPPLVYHFDCYRIRTLAEALDFGFEDYMESGSLCLIEWPENVEPLLPADVVDAHITVQPDGSRILTLS